MKRLQISVDPFKIWVGVQVASTHILICPLPCLVLRWTRAWWIRRMEEA